ncbi:biliverdin-producing heme oxygenase [Gemmatimonas groenlandica]|uniref:Biliverdin-producing heme oxygenase n=1 Tax=Gemmatimonas groenlandica TaxID=2732249 RepID=A0A6M4IVR4_9BACT|nr:biliverdin-producing heme oxygenase [Gemmatimonas groenlandica]QJR37606.1 biliverdin-producing heme oxygenase [Gemmatimonas groenlandica]
MILQVLKDVTRESHLALERLMPLLDADLAAAEYRRMVQKLFTYHKPLEAMLFSSPGFAEIGLDYAERAKTTRLANDLCALGVSADEVAQMHSCESLPPLADPSHVFGCLYVLEGATLGGQIVTRHLQASLGLTPETGASYFSGYGVRTGPQWKAFCALLTGYAARTGADTDIVDGANATYETLTAWMHVVDVEPTTASGTGSVVRSVLA